MTAKVTAKEGPKTLLALLEDQFITKPNGLIVFMMLGVLAYMVSIVSQGVWDQSGQKAEQVRGQFTSVVSTLTHTFFDLIMD